jgi:hypothetical protein
MNLQDNANGYERSGLSLVKNSETRNNAEAHGLFRATLLRDGKIVWEDEFHNLVLTAGKNDALDKYLAGSGYTAAWYMGLVDGGSTPTYAAADTAASHAGWTENVGYSNATRPSIAWNAASAGSKASTATVFNINANGTIAGCFITTLSAKNGATGIIYSAGSFGAGNRLVQTNDTLSVTWTGSL